jgi:hypothetical protein
MRSKTGRREETELRGIHRTARRQVLRDAALSLAGASMALERVVRAEEVCRADLAINETTALIFSAESPLRPEEGLNDARAVWCHVPNASERNVLLFFHGHNGYVTVDAQGRSRVPDWAAGRASSRAGASAKSAAPLVYGLDRLGSKVGTKEPIVLVPEVSTLATGSFWAREPAGQYADTSRLGRVVEDCRNHLACLSKPGGGRYIRPDVDKALIARIYLCGHSGAGVPLEEAAGSSLILPEKGVPTDLWLFDCTYWSKVAGFVRFCERWCAVGRLEGSRSDAARFVCVYRPKTQTEEVADELRGAIARILDVNAASLLKNHSPENFAAEVRPALRKSGVLFVRTELSHDAIPGFFIPALIETASE